METLKIDINNPFHPLYREKYRSFKGEAFEVRLSDLNKETELGRITVDWGDGSKNEYMGTADVVHLYLRNSFPIMYQITVNYSDKDDFQNITFQDNLLLKRIMGPLPEVSTSLSALFKGCYYLELIGRDVFKYNTKHDRIDSIFEDCESLDYIDIDSKLPVNNVKSASRAFKNTKFNKLPFVNQWENLEVAEYMFSNMKNITTIPMNYFEKSTRLKVARGMFAYTERIENFGYNPFFNCKELQDLSYLFYGCPLVTLKDNFYTYLNPSVDTFNIT